MTAAASLSPAATIEYATPAGSTVTVGGTTSSVSAKAVFVTEANKVTLTLSNLQSDPRSVAQGISDIFFSVMDGDEYLNDATIASGAGHELWVDNKGAYTVGSAVVNPARGLSNSSDVFHLSVLGTATAPTHLILGPPAGTKYPSKGSGSIAGNPAHNPFLYQTATWVFDVPGATELSGVYNVTFSFGTAPGINVHVPSDPPPPQVPEPASMMLLGGGLGLVGAARAARRWKSSQK